MRGLWGIINLLIATAKENFLRQIGADVTDTLRRQTTIPPLRNDGIGLAASTLGLTGLLDVDWLASKVSAQRLLYSMLGGSL
jgi:hypothetical protein